MKKCFFSLITLLISLASLAQNRSGVSFFLEGGYWKQNNLNLVLSSVNAKTPSVSFGFGLGSFYQIKKIEAEVEAQFAMGRRSGNADRVTQNVGLTNLSFKYHFPVNRSSFYPLLGVGFAGAKTEVSQRNGPTNISATLVSRNTTTLYNRQGFALVGLGTRVYEKNGRNFYTIEVGYRLGFGASLWNTDEELAYDMTSSVTDELRQVYLKLGFGFARLRTKRN